MRCTYKLGVDPLPLLREPQRVSACLDVHGGPRRVVVKWRCEGPAGAHAPGRNEISG